MKFLSVLAALVMFAGITYTVRAADEKPAPGAGAAVVAATVTTGTIQAADHAPGKLVVKDATTGKEKTYTLHASGDVEKQVKALIGKQAKVTGVVKNDGIKVDSVVEVK